MALTCKNCGGSILLNNNTKMIVCDCCGTEQSLNSVLSGDCEFIFNNNESVASVIKKYDRARSLMAIDENENSLFAAAEIFDQIQDDFDSAELAKDCREKALRIKTEKTYQKAMGLMCEDDVEKIKSAICMFESLANYKDSKNKIEECKPLLQKAEQKRQEYILKQQRIEAGKLAKKKRKKCLFILFGIIFIAAIIAINFAKYSKSNIHISIKPSTKNYFSERGSNYVFNYDVELQNKSMLDINSIEINVIIEKEDGEILADTNVNFYDYSTPVVRSNKKSNCLWELTIYSDSIAYELYESDFQDLKIEVDIKRVEYENGKFINY